MTTKAAIPRTSSSESSESSGAWWSWPCYGPSPRRSCRRSLGWEMPSMKDDEHSETAFSKGGEALPGAHCRDEPRGSLLLHLHHDLVPISLRLDERSIGLRPNGGHPGSSWTDGPQLEQRGATTPTAMRVRRRMVSASTQEGEWERQSRT